MKIFCFHKKSQLIALSGTVRLSGFQVTGKELENLLAEFLKHDRASD